MAIFSLMFLYVYVLCLLKLFSMWVSVKIFVSTKKKIIFKHFSLKNRKKNAVVHEFSRGLPEVKSEEKQLKEKKKKSLERNERAECHTFIYILLRDHN